jgi:hypothetical protein
MTTQLAGFRVVLRSIKFVDDWSHSTVVVEALC